jgi:hypothetical protein
MLAFMQLIFRWLLEVTNVPLALAEWQYAISLSTVLLGAAGYVINDILIRIPTLKTDLKTSL